MRAAHKWWEEWTGTATKKQPKKPTNDGNKLPPMSFGNSQNARAKEIQNVYTQKAKTNPGPNPNQKSAPVLKTRPIDETVKPKDSIQDQEYISLRCKVVGEDERDNFGDMNPIMEQASASEISLMGEDEAPPIAENRQDENILEKELQTETTFDGNQVEGFKVASFRIRKPGASSLVNDLTKKILLSKSLSCLPLIN